MKFRWFPARSKNGITTSRPATTTKLDDDGKIVAITHKKSIVLALESAALSSADDETDKT